ncbi:hypothetical protein HETIRDRAFT_322938, partial [Heterobasidion irregulare TC 32-1]
EDVQQVAEAFGYSLQDLQSVPVESHLGLSCGNPIAAASIKGGENVLDLGSGGGIDVFLAASKVGAQGHVIGLDMSPDMVARARLNAEKNNLRPPRVAFVQAQLTEPLPIVSDSIDCVLSNCVINLLPGSRKASILKEIYRVLRPGGRLVLDDIIAKQPLPEYIRNDLASYVSCISGAIQVDEYRVLLAAAGLEDVVFVDTKGDINVYYQTQPASSPCCSPAASSGPSKPTPDFNANEWVASYQIYAIKPQLEDYDPQAGPTAPLLRWWDAYPDSESADLPSLSAQAVAELVRDKTRKDFAVIDVRRNDHAGGHVRSSYQCPAQTFYDDLPEFYQRFKEVEKVVFYCGSSNGRGPRCAGWYRKHLMAVGNAKSQAYILEGGIKAWLKEFAHIDELVDTDW